MRFVLTKWADPVAEEKKPGLLKRIFSFGFGRKKGAEPEPSPEIDEDVAPPAEPEHPVEVIEADAADKPEPVAAPKKAEKKPAKKPEKPKAVKKPAAKKQPAKPTKEATPKAESKPKQKTEIAEKVEPATKKAKAEPEKAEPEKTEPEKAEPEKTDAKQAEPKKPAAKKKPLAIKPKEEAPVEPVKPEPDEDTERKEGWFKRLRKGLSKSSTNLTERVTSVFTKKKLDDETLQDLEDVLIQADLGVETSMNITAALLAQRYGKDVTDEEVRQIMAEEITKVLDPVAMPLELDLSHQPHVILVVGVNGSGKTTTIGKLSQKLHESGYDTMLVAGDTFRAAAIEQLHIWGDRTNASVVSREHGADAAGLAFDAWEEAKAQGRDVMMMDTAGRLQNRKELMDELEKIIRVLKKQDPAAPHTVLLTLDATTGQNALNQVEIFREVAGVNGLVMTKLDGTARGGILVSIAAKHKLPVYFVGVGEQVEDLEPFEADVFARAIAGLDS